jgi:leucyl-tRNA synthetase
MYLMFLGPFQEGGDFREEGITGVRRFLEKVWIVAHEAAGAADGAPPPEVARKLHQTIRKVTGDTERLDYNTAIAAMMEYMNVMRTRTAWCGRRRWSRCSPVRPHLAELWATLGHVDLRYPVANLG